MAGLEPTYGGVIVKEMGSVMVIAAAFDWAESVTEVAVSVTEAGLGTLAGAVYVTGTPEVLVAGETVPHAAPVQPFPVRVQLTPLF